MDGLTILLGGGFFTFLGVMSALFATRKKSQAETLKAQADIKRLEEETEQLRMENQNMLTEQINSMMKQNNELSRAREELKAKLSISNEEKLLLSKELSIYRIESAEKQRKIDELSKNHKKFEELLATHDKDIVEIKKTQTGPLPSRSELNSKDAA